nr:MAG TPA: hypothetical protein [Bacteriophage sp.]
MPIDCGIVAHNGAARGVFLSAFACAREGSGF